MFAVRPRTHCLTSILRYRCWRDLPILTRTISLLCSACLLACCRPTAYVAVQINIDQYSRRSMKQSPPTLSVGHCSAASPCIVCFLSVRVVTRCRSCRSMLTFLFVSLLLILETTLACNVGELLSIFIII